MTTLAWSDELKRGLGFQDKDHEETINLMYDLKQCTDDELPNLFDQLFVHTNEHFEHENELMERIDFFAISTHKSEHERVLAEMQVLKDRLNAGDIAAVRHYIQETLPMWFLNHLKSMDAITAQLALQAYEK